MPAPVSADRNLLFGLLALAAQFVAEPLDLGGTGAGQDPPRCPSVSERAGKRPQHRAQRRPTLKALGLAAFLAGAAASVFVLVVAVMAFGYLVD